MIRLSIIIPVCNDKDKVKRCIDSVTSYKGKDIEVVLLANENSVNSLKLCAEYANLDKRIKLFKDDASLHLIKNEAIKIITGKYFTILNSYNLFEVSSFAKVLNMLSKNDFDIITLNHKLLLENNEIKVSEFEFENEKEFNSVLDNNIYKNILKDTTINTFASSLFNTETIKENNITFKSDLDNDYGFLLQAFDNIKSGISFDIPLFIYEEYNLFKDNDLINVFNQLEIEYKNKLLYSSKWNCSEETNENIYNYYFKLIYNLFSKQYESTKENKQNTNDLKDILKKDFIQELLHKVNASILDSKWKRRLSMLKLGNLKILSLAYKINA